MSTYGLVQRKHALAHIAKNVLLLDDDETRGLMGALGHDVYSFYGLTEEKISSIKSCDKHFFKNHFTPLQSDVLTILPFSSLNCPWLFPLVMMNCQASLVKSFLSFV